MAHRAKHLRRNWIPERLAKAQEREKAENQRRGLAMVQDIMGKIETVKK